MLKASTLTQLVCSTTNTLSGLRRDSEECGEQSGAAAHVHQHHGHQHRQPGWSLPPFGLHDDAAEEEFAKRSISSTEQTEQQQQGLIHPGPGRPGANNNVSILLK